MTGIVILLLAVTLSPGTPPSTKPSEQLDTEALREAVNHLPPHVRIAHDRVTYSAFDLESYKKLLVLSYDHKLMAEAEALYKARVQNLEDQKKLLEQTNESLRQSTETWSKAHDRLLKKWTEENEKRRLAEMKAASVWPWVIMGLGGGVAGAGGIGLGFDYENGWAWGSVAVGAGLIIIGLVDGLL